MRDLTREEYTSVLIKMLSWHTALERLFTIMLPPDIVKFVGTTDYSSPLRDDLNSLEYTELDTTSEAELDICGPDQIIGAIYVMLGSTNGAKIISRHLKRVKPLFPIHYYTECAKEAESWQQFIAWLSDYDKDMSQKQRKSVLTGARKSFEFLLD
ncbi:biliverdin-producing heme oxygenase [Alteromonas flava]|uniref:biliverdin-producing heme oxygenase n=1 Tax=Alteromonas flava TaxID=2048003 RepID=UPI000C28D570